MSTHRSRREESPMQAVVRRMLDEDAPTSEIIIDVPPGEAKNTVCLIFTARHERAERDAS